MNNEKVIVNSWNEWDPLKHVIVGKADGTSLIPIHGNHTQNIPPITSVSESKVRSAAGIFFDPIEYKIKPIHTRVP